MSSPSTELNEAKAQIEEINPAQVRRRLTDGDGVVVDVRERHEWDAGHLAGAHHIPREQLAERIGEIVTDYAQPIVAYCAVGNRSALAGVTLKELGYEDIHSMAGGIALWKDLGFEIEEPQTLTAQQRERYSRHLLVPEVGVGQK